MSMLDGHPFNFPLFELYCAPIYAPIAHHFFMNVRKHLSSFKSLQAQKMRYSFIFNDLCQTVKNSIGLVANYNAQFHICSQLLCCLAWHAIPFKNLTWLLIITHPSSFLKARLDFRCDFYLTFLWMPMCRIPPLRESSASFCAESGRFESDFCLAVDPWNSPLSSQKCRM